MFDLTISGTRKSPLIDHFTAVFDPLEQFEILPAGSNIFLMIGVSIFIFDSLIVFLHRALTNAGNQLPDCLNDSALIIQPTTPLSLYSSATVRRVSITTAWSRISFYNNILTIFYFIYAEVVRPVVYSNLNIKYQIYFPLFFYLFRFIFFFNVLGLIPFSFAVTSAFVVTLFLAGSYFIMVNIIGFIKWDWKLSNLFLPDGVPSILVPALIIIEAVSYFARIPSLSIRLFANIMSGHALLKILIGSSWIMLTSTKPLMLIAAIVPWVIVTVVMFLEMLIAFLQAYVFTILVTIYTNDVINLH